MTEKEEAVMKRFACFAVRYYVPNWFVAPLATSAPRNDLKYLQDLECSDDKELASTTSKALRRHLWYLSEELVAFAFLDDEVPLDLKSKMVVALQKPSMENALKRCVLNDNETVQGKTLADFVTELSHSFFTKLGLEAEFLQKNPSEWHNRSDYKKV
jgi:hypothetical protein